MELNRCFRSDLYCKRGNQCSTIASRSELRKFIDHLNSISFLNKVRINIALKHETKSFLKLKIKVRDKIVADGLNDDSFDVTKKGIHLNAKEFNKLMKEKIQLYWI